MRLLQIKAKNFRTLEDITVCFLSNYCTVSGHNNAGKSCVIDLIGILLSDSTPRPWALNSEGVTYKEDKTQWIKNAPSIELTYNLQLSRVEDQSLTSFIERVSATTIKNNTSELIIEMVINSNDQVSYKVLIDSTEVGEPVSKDIIDKLKSPNSLFLHNSTRDHNEYYFRSGKPVSLYNLPLSTQDQNGLKKAETDLRNRVKKVAKAQTSELNLMLGKLRDKFDVELSPIDTSSRRVALGINLTDKNVEMPLPAWGSGTQNRTRILMSVLQANRIRIGQEPEDRITPLVVIEEPESFLHPSAQADFGKLLQALSDELKIQIIVSTHSPYMLNQVDTSSNILMKRQVHRRKTLKTEIVKTDEENWMAPFADHLGLIPPEFENWRKIFSSKGSRVVLVEGEIDKEYIEFLRAKFPKEFPLPENVEVVPYGGKDALKNTLMTKFILSRLTSYFVTFDLDAASEVTKFLEKIGLTINSNFAAVGLKRAGRQAIEGLLPERVLQAVHGRETDLMMVLSSGSADERKSAKSQIKRKLLEEFQAHEDYSKEEIGALIHLGSLIAKPFV